MAEFGEAGGDRREMVKQGQGLLHAQPVAAPSCLHRRPQLPRLPREPGRVSQPCRGRCCCPWAQGAHDVPGRAHPALPRRVRTPPAAVAKALVCPWPFAERVLQHPAPSPQHQLSEGPLGCRGSRTGPGPSLSCDFRDASRESLEASPPPASSPSLTAGGAGLETPHGKLRLDITHSG